MGHPRRMTWCGWCRSDWYPFSCPRGGGSRLLTPEEPTQAASTSFCPPVTRRIVVSYPGGLPYLDASRASSGSISRTIAHTAAIRAARSAESALLRSASSWSMASATRRRADPSVEHTIEDYQAGDAFGGSYRSLVIHRILTHACGKSLWIITGKSTSDFFFHTAGGSHFPCSQP